MVTLGYKVVVVEQTETSKMAELRNNQKDVPVNREIQGCYSKGTRGIESWVFSIYKNDQNQISCCYFDLAS